MADMFFNDEVRRIIFEAAPRIAEELGHREIEPEDLLLATLSVSTTAALLQGLKIDLKGLTERLRAAAPRGSYHPRTKREYSIASGRRTIRMWNEARRRGVSEVGVYEFLLAMLEAPPRRFLFLFPRRLPPFWATLDAAGLDRASVMRTIEAGGGAA